MVRSPPPPAIHPSLASAAAIEDGTPKQSSDLPLRNYTSTSLTTSTAVSQAATPNQVQLPPTPPHDSAGILSGIGRICTTPTPSSTVAEFGDRRFFANKSAVSLVENVGRSYSRTRSQSETSGADRLSHNQIRSRSQSRSNTPTPTPRGGSYTPRSARSQSTSHHRQTSSRDRGIATNEKVNRLLHSISNTSAPLESQAELLLENRSLQQRISALQRTESDLLEQNQRLTHQLESLKKQYDVRIRQWKDEVREGKKKLQDRIRALEAEVVEKDQQLQGLGLDNELGLSDEDIRTWFAERTKAWHVWTEEFGHRDPNRVQTGLHPLQMRELCEGVKSFVSLTDGDKLPDELLNGIGDGKAKAAHVLLYGMLSHFIIYEALQSPFWVFAAFSGSALELESPIVPRNNSMSPVGFRMDLAMWNNIASLGDSRLPQPLAARRDGAAAQLVGSITDRMSLAPSTRSLSLDTANLTSLPKPSLPGKQDMENLYNVLAKGQYTCSHLSHNILVEDLTNTYLLLPVQTRDQDAHKWRRHLMRTLSEGGLILDANHAKSPDSRLLVEARENYAKKLKERFLAGPARYLLEDQDATGIEKLERRLLHELDLALRFSCKVWSRRDQLKFSSLPEFVTTEFHACSPIMQLCQIQAPASVPVKLSKRHGDGVEDFGSDAPPAYHDGSAVIMVVQPAVGSVRANGCQKESEQTPVIWAKAQVLVRTPIIPSLTGSARAPTTCIVGKKIPAGVETCQTVPEQVLAPVSMQTSSPITLRLARTLQSTSKANSEQS